MADSDGMRSHDLTLYDAWDMAEARAPARSPLFSLEPIGVGTPGVECLTGYIARLAEAHSITTGALAWDVLVPRLGRPYLERRIEGLSSLWRSSRAINGTLTWAQDMVAVLEAVTGRADVRFLTMLPWTTVLDWKGLVRETRAWCAFCYSEWRQQGKPVYEPLLWNLEPVVMCPHHGQSLETRCPHPGCGRSLLLLSTRSRPGFCSRCQRWLGRESSSEGSQSSAPRASHEEWTARVLGQLLAAGSGLDAPPTREQIADSIQRCANVLTRGFVSQLAGLCGIDRKTMYQWLHGTSPGIGMLLRACWHMGVSPVDFLIRPDSMAPTRAAMSDPSNDPWPRTARRNPREAAAIRNAVVAWMEAHRESPASVGQVVRELGLRYDELYRVCPDLLREIGSSYRAASRRRSDQRIESIREQVREAVARLHAQGVYPSVNRVREILPQKAILRLPVARQAWFDALREHGWEMGGHRAKMDPETWNSSSEADNRLSPVSRF